MEPQHVMMHAAVQPLIEGYEQDPQEQQQAFKVFTLYFLDRSLENSFWAYPLDYQRAALRSFFLFNQTLTSNTINLRVFNPSPERDGYTSTRTIIEIAQADAPFIIDSLQMVLNRLGIESEPTISLAGIQCIRTTNGELSAAYSPDAHTIDSACPEAPVRIEIAKIHHEVQLTHLHAELYHTLVELHRAFNDWQPIRERCQSIIEELEHYKRQFPSDETREAITFLKWLLDDNFIFLGYRQYHLIGMDQDAYIEPAKNSGLGLLHSTSSKKRLITSMPTEAQRLVKANKVLIITKSNTKSLIHRPAYTDYIGIKRFDETGKLIGEHRFIGLFSHTAYNQSLKAIPFLRQKVCAVLAQSKLPAQGHSGKKLINIMESFPRDDLFQIGVNDLFETSMAILHLQERKVIRLFARKDAYGRFYSCLVYLPKEKATLEFDQKFMSILQQFLGSDDISSSIYYGDSATARFHYVVRVSEDSRTENTPDFPVLEQSLIECCKTWVEKLQEYLKQHFDAEEASTLFQRYQHSFSMAYQEDFSAAQAAHDIRRLESLTEENPLAMAMFPDSKHSDHRFRIKLFQLHQPIPLSSIIPVFENMGLEVLEEHPYECQLNNQQVGWICDYALKISIDAPLCLESLKPLLSDLFFAVWSKTAENDRLNALVQLTSNPWQKIVVIRAYARYLKQTTLPYGQSFVEDALLKHYAITHQLLNLFVARFSLEPQPEDLTIHLKTDILGLLSKVSNLDEDKILRTFLALIEATLRTNFYQTTNNGQAKPYLSFKLQSAKVPTLPLPHPLFEVFVYSPRFEAIHLRAAKVARGGIRWSDRREDFRTEVLGLMKAQQVKNAVIVPGGSKGGFVLKATHAKMSRDELQQEAILCYQNFMRGLLDLTDNFQGSTVIHPPQVKRYDEDDPYLVVAADKGTASFSDYANAIAEEYDYWLNDAFASGGSFGYDHKKIAITARGAWISVEAHFKTLGIDPSTMEFTAIGIGDMNGDVFGNGMLRSRKTKLLAAFNHLHIFIDPNPDAEASFKERERLFHLPSSSWLDYNPQHISTGGGIFARSAKEITLTPEIKALLETNEDTLEPNALIHRLLSAKVDLLFNGGIGTYVKASMESHLEVGDKANDALRVNAKQLQCRVVGEGGNLGFTQRGRIEYAQNGGLIFTDFIDNSAGVDLSDHEVNTKILLSYPVNHGELSLDERNDLLKAMTDEVADLVLSDNRAQTELLNYSTSQAVNELEVFGRCLTEFERSGKINREVEFLPSEQVIRERFKNSLGLTAPEIAILLAYVKMDIKQDLLKSTLLDESYFLPALEQEFPTRLNVGYQIALNQHRLKREITATQLVNQLLTETSIIFVKRLQEETNCSVAAIVKAYAVVREVFKVPRLLQLVRDQDYKISTDAQHQIRTRICRFTRRATRWLLRHHLPNGAILDTVQSWQLITDMTQHLVSYLQGVPKLKCQSLLDEYLSLGVSQPVAEELAAVRSYYALLDINAMGVALEQTGPTVARAYFAIGERLGLGWLREEITNHQVSNHWEALAHSSQRDELDQLQARITQAFLQQALDDKDDLTQWFKQHEIVFNNWQTMLENLQRAGKTNYVMHSVALKTLSDVISQL